MKRPAVVLLALVALGGGACATPSRYVPRGHTPAGHLYLGYEGAFRVTQVGSGQTRRAGSFLDFDDLSSLVGCSPQAAGFARRADGRASTARALRWIEGITFWGGLAAGLAVAAVGADRRDNGLLLTGLAVGTGTGIASLVMEQSRLEAQAEAWVNGLDAINAFNDGHALAPACGPAPPMASARVPNGARAGW